MRIPEGVREVIGRRLDRLSERCNQALTVASVIGREFTLEQLAKLVEDISEDRLLEVLEEALAARVIEELPRAGGALPVHPCPDPGDAGGGAVATRRVRLHARIAQALEALYGAQAEAHAAELAYHYGEAEAVLGTDKLVQYSLLAGEKALAGYAYEEALAHFQRGLAAKEGQPVDHETADLLFGLGRAQTAAFELSGLQEAAENLQRACAAYIAIGDQAGALATAAYPYPAIHDARGFADTIAQVLDLVPPTSRDAGYLLAQYGKWLSMEKADPARALEALDRASSIARQHHDTALEARVEIARVPVFAFNGLD